MAEGSQVENSSVTWREPGRDENGDGYLWVGITVAGLLSLPVWAAIFYAIL